MIKSILTSRFLSLTLSLALVCSTNLYAGDISLDRQDGDFFDGSGGGDPFDINTGDDPGADDWGFGNPGSDAGHVPDPIVNLPNPGLSGPVINAGSGGSGIPIPPPGGTLLGPGVTGGDDGFTFAPGGTPTPTDDAGRPDSGEPKNTNPGTFHVVGTGLLGPGPGGTVPSPAPAPTDDEGRPESGGARNTNAGTFHIGTTSYLGLPPGGAAPQIDSAPAPSGDFVHQVELNGQTVYVTEEGRNALNATQENQRVLNWNAVQSSVTDFNQNASGVNNSPTPKSNPDAKGTALITGENPILTDTIPVTVTDRALDPIQIEVRSPVEGGNLPPVPANSGTGTSTFSVDSFFDVATEIDLPANGVAGTEGFVDVATAHVLSQQDDQLKGNYSSNPSYTGAALVVGEILTNPDSNLGKDPNDPLGILNPPPPSQPTNPATNSDATTPNVKVNLNPDPNPESIMHDIDNQFFPGIKMQPRPQGGCEAGDPSCLSTPPIETAPIDVLEGLGITEDILGKCIPGDPGCSAPPVETSACSAGDPGCLSGVPSGGSNPIEDPLEPVGQDETDFFNDADLSDGIEVENDPALIATKLGSGTEDDFGVCTPGAPGCDLVPYDDSGETTSFTDSDDWSGLCTPGDPGCTAAPIDTGSCTAGEPGCDLVPYDDPLESTPISSDDDWSDLCTPGDPGCGAPPIDTGPCTAGDPTCTAPPIDTGGCDAGDPTCLSGAGELDPLEDELLTLQPPPKPLPPPDKNAPAKKWLVTGGQVKIDGLPNDRVSKIDSIKWDQKVVSDEVGGKEPQTEGVLPPQHTSDHSSLHTRKYRGDGTDEDSRPFVSLGGTGGYVVGEFNDPPIEAGDKVKVLELGPSDQANGDYQVNVGISDLSTDQRGLGRDGVSDIGGFEYEPPEDTEREPLETTYGGNYPTDLNNGLPVVGPDGKGVGDLPLPDGGAVRGPGGLIGPDGKYYPYGGPKPPPDPKDPRNQPAPHGRDQRGYPLPDPADQPEPTTEPETDHNNPDVDENGFGEDLDDVSSQLQGHVVLS